MIASISKVTVTSDPTNPVRWAITSSPIRLPSRPTRSGSTVTVPWKRLRNIYFVGDSPGAASLALSVVVPMPSACTSPAPVGRRYRWLLCGLCRHLRLCDRWPYKEARVVGSRNKHAAGCAQSAVAPRGFVIAIGICKGILFP